MRFFSTSTREQASRTGRRMLFLRTRFLNFLVCSATLSRAIWWNYRRPSFISIRSREKFPRICRKRPHSRVGRSSGSGLPSLIFFESFPAFQSRGWNFFEFGRQYSLYLIQAVLNLFLPADPWGILRTSRGTPERKILSKYRRKSPFKVST